MARAICKIDCWDSSKAIYYQHGRTYDIDLENPIARHFRFETEPEETEVDVKTVLKPVDLGGKVELIAEEIKPQEEKRGRGNPNLKKHHAIPGSIEEHAAKKITESENQQSVE